MQMLYQVLKGSLGRSDLVDSCYERLALLRSRLEKLLEVDKTGISFWFDTSRRHISLHYTPLSIADKFNELVFAQSRCWVFTSATLSVDGGFDQFTQQMGLAAARTLQLDSPFNYPEQAMLLVAKVLAGTDRSENGAGLVAIGCAADRSK